MISAALRCTVLIAGCGLGSGCASLAESLGGPVSTPEIEIASVVSEPEDDPLAVLADVSSGDVVTLDHEELGSGEFRVLDAYPAASGRQCRRVAPLSGGDLRIVCQRASGRWSVTRQLTAAQLDRQASETLS